MPVGERQPLLRPTAAKQVWSMDFVFDRTADGRVIKCLLEAICRRMWRRAVATPTGYISGTGG